MPKTWYEPYVSVDISVMEKDNHDAEPVTTTELQ